MTEIVTSNAPWRAWRKDDDTLVGSGQTESEAISDLLDAEHFFNEGGSPLTASSGERSAWKSRMERAR